MILEHSNAAPYNVQLLQSSYWKFKVDPTNGAELAQWTVIVVPLTQHCEVTSCRAKRMQEPNFWHYRFKKLAKMREARQGAVGLCQIIMTLHGISKAAAVLSVLMKVCTIPCHDRLH